MEGRTGGSSSGGSSVIQRGTAQGKKENADGKERKGGRTGPGKGESAG